MQGIKSPEDVLRFWFDEHGPHDWFSGEKAFDAKVVTAFEQTHRAARACELSRWRQSSRGRVAEIIVLDQFSRQIHRGRADAFACDAIALALAQEAVAAGADKDMNDQQRQFLYMPYMHSESLAVHGVAKRLFASLDDGGNTLKFEEAHRVVIERFGRYPTRNKALGRVNTPEEDAYLADPASSAF